MEILDRLSHWAGWASEEDALDDATMPEPGSGGAVQVMTVHASKGLEFDVTILPDLTSAGQKDKSALRAVQGVGMALKFEEEENPEAYDEVGAKNAERDLAESKRLLYVAMTRAKEECLLILPRLAPPKEGKEPKEKKKESWSDLIRGSGIRNPLSIVDEQVALPADPAAASARAEIHVEARPPLSRLETSISELAAYQFCGEFHRRKFVQGWDDQIVALWPAEGTKQHGPQRKRKSSPERDEAARLLKKLKLENKERGIALHRVLERVVEEDLTLGELWLREAYSAQGVPEEAEELTSLVRLDLQLLHRFLSSDLGRELFSRRALAYPEIPFQWSLSGAIVHGTMDRLIRKENGVWVVVDYKSSILEESLERYRFQVASYMAAVAEHAKGQGEAVPQVEGYLVDLYESRAYPVESSPEDAAARLVLEIERLRGNYTLEDAHLAPGARGIESGEHCFHCPYSASCDLGRKLCYD